METKRCQLELTKIADYSEPVVLVIRPEGMPGSRFVTVFRNEDDVRCTGLASLALAVLRECELTEDQIEIAERNGYVLAYE